MSGAATPDEFKPGELGPGGLRPSGPRPAEAEPTAPESADYELAAPERVAPEVPETAEPAPGGRRVAATRPLGQAPLLDSDPLPATRPGMLRPRTNGARPGGDGPTLPTQRPAVDAGSGEPADIA
jgi:hypothetical protein